MESMFDNMESLLKDDNSNYETSCTQKLKTGKVQRTSVMDSYKRDIVDNVDNVLSECVLLT